MKNIAFIIISTLIGLYGFVSLAPSGSVQFGAVGEAEIAPWFRYLFAFSLVLAGVFLGSMYRKAVELKNQNLTQILSFKLFLRGTLRSIDFVISLAGAPVVFALILQQAPNISLIGLAMIALQNGFVSPIIIGSVTPTLNVPASDNK